MENNNSCLKSRRPLTAVKDQESELLGLDGILSSIWLKFGAREHLSGRCARWKRRFSLWSPLRRSVRCSSKSEGNFKEPYLEDLAQININLGKLLGASWITEKRPGSGRRRWVDQHPQGVPHFEKLFTPCSRSFIDRVRSWQLNCASTVAKLLAWARAFE